MSSDIPITTTPIQDISIDLLRRWVIDCIEEYSLTRKMWNNIASLLNLLYAEAMDRDIVTANKYKQLNIKKFRKLFQKPQYKPDSARVYTDDEFEAISQLAFKRVERSQTLAPLAFVLQGCLGDRIGEVVALKYSDINPELGTIHIQRQYLYKEHRIDEYTKGTGEDREIPLTTSAVKAIEKCKQIQSQHGIETEFILWTSTTAPPGYVTFTRAYRSMCKELGIDYKATHACRRRGITKVGDKLGLEAAREFAGHESVGTTYGYLCDTHEKVEKRKKIAQALDISIQDNM